MFGRSAIAAAAGALVVLTGTAEGSAAADRPCTSAQACLGSFTLAEGASMPYYRSFPLAGSSAATQAVIVVHGTERNAANYFDRMVQAARDAGADSTTEIIAPHFQIAEDKPAAREVSWTNGDDTSWKDGGDSVSPAGISSFTVIDEILTKLADKQRFPALTRITLAGHSAGGQFVQRYAVGGVAPAQLPGVSFRYVTANPSSYLYFTPDRPVGTGLPGSCPAYDDYKYGLNHLNAYLGEFTGDQLIKQYVTRKVTYLLGGGDVHQDHGIDQSCAAETQGHYRLVRGQNYFSSIAKNYPAAPHEKVIVPGVGHDSGAMFDSSQGRAAIFG
ncbi:hypothetical protein [Amycolatopsis sp. H20-H5]|uniref:hypothetical protein n=1 Tax=Amycolatopsis sp. H20-H5 TaxID=3046309 RepID=UPI002DBC5BDB|nr:hypothetical protein [Amycolatopsis sp. H20-H5]MEC3978245.1 hypothetical protein [Amycolatopsis sp. H20-H5]